MDPERLIDHIGDCIHEFSLRSLPWAQSVDRKDFMWTPTADELFSKWLEDVQLSTVKEENPDLKFLSFETQIPAPETLLVVSEYFADRSETSSRVEAKSPSWDPDLPELNFSSGATRGRSEHNPQSDSSESLGAHSEKDGKCRTATHNVKQSLTLNHKKLIPISFFPAKTAP